MRCVRAKGKEILDIAALLAFPETFGMGGVTVRKLLVRRPLCLCRFRFSLPRPSRLPPLFRFFFRRDARLPSGIPRIRGTACGIRYVCRKRSQFPADEIRAQRFRCKRLARRG